MKILLYPNFSRGNVKSGALATLEKLCQLGLQPMLADFNRENLASPRCIYAPLEQALQECDLILSIGGDGSVLYAAQDAVRAGKPLMGINRGRVGFLTQLEMSELDYLSLLAKGEYRLSPRMMLEVEYELDGQLCKKIALNEVVVRRKDPFRMLNFRVWHGENQMLLHQRADGAIFATPTGSTAYSLAAGGPVLSPEMTAVILGAICPHASFPYTLVRPCEVTYHIEDLDAVGFLVIADGQQTVALQPGQEARIRRYERPLQLVDLGVRDFYDNLEEKLIWRRKAI
jgi:Predicted sugar kinase